MIRTVRDKNNKNKGEVILYSKDGKKVLRRYGFRTESGRLRAIEKAKKAEKQIAFFKSQN